MFLITVSFSILVASLERRDLFRLQMYPNIAQKIQLWRFITSPLFFSTPGDFFLGTYLLYAFRGFERMFGTKKFAATVFVLSTLTSIFQTLFLLISRKTPVVASGPYALIFGLFPFFFMDVPNLSFYRICGLRVSDKLFTYVLGLQVALSSMPESGISAACALLAGILYRSVPAFRSIRLPAGIASFIERHLTNLFSSSHRAGGYARVNQADMADADMGMGMDPLPAGDMARDQLAESPNDLQPIQPDQASVMQLVGMGFAEVDVRRALIQSQNNVVVATNRLVEGTR